MTDEERTKINVLLKHAECTEEIVLRDSVIRPVAEIRAWGDMFRTAADELIQFKETLRGGDGEQ